MLQLLTKVGILNVPDWFDAGKVSIQNSFAPFSKSICFLALSSTVAEQAHKIVNLPEFVSCTFQKAMPHNFACDQLEHGYTGDFGQYFRAWSPDVSLALQCRHSAGGPILLVWMGGG